VVCRREFPLYVSPNFKWIWVNQSWYYVADAGEKLVAPSNGPLPVPFERGADVPFDPTMDLLHVTFQEHIIAYLSIYLSIYLYICISIDLSFYSGHGPAPRHLPGTYYCIYIYIYLSIYLSICISIDVSFYPGHGPASRHIPGIYYYI